MHIPQGHSVAFQSGQRHEIEVVLAALHDADVPAVALYYSDVGEAPTPGQTSYSLWLVVVPSEQLLRARSLIKALPVSADDHPVTLVGPVPIGGAVVALACAVVIAFLLVLLLARS